MPEIVPGALNHVLGLWRNDPRSTGFGVFPDGNPKTSGLDMSEFSGFPGPRAFGVNPNGIQGVRPVGDLPGLGGLGNARPAPMPNNPGHVGNIPPAPMPNKPGHVGRTPPVRMPGLGGDEPDSLEDFYGGLVPRIKSLEQLRELLR